MGASSRVIRVRRGPQGPASTLVLLLTIASTRGVPCEAVTLRVPQDYPTVSLAAGIAQSADTILVRGQEYINDDATIRSGVIVRGVPNPPWILHPRFYESTFTLPDGPDSTRIELLSFVEEPGMSQIVAFTSRVVISNCYLQAPSPLYASSVQLWNGGAVRHTRFWANGELTTAISLRQGTLDVAHCVFTNTWYSVAVLNKQQQLADVRISNNTMVRAPALIRLELGGQLDITNNIFVQGGIVDCDAGHPNDVRYNDFYINSSSLCGYGIGNIFEDPLICDWPNEFYLNSASPCIGSGEGGENMGAFGVGCGVVAAIPDESQSSPRALAVSAFPNPFLDATTIQVQRLGGENVHATIYDAGGRIVEDLGRFLSQDEVQIRWDAREYPAGVYFYRVETPSRSVVGRVARMR